MVITWQCFSLHEFLTSLSKQVSIECQITKPEVTSVAHHNKDNIIVNRRMLSFGSILDNKTDENLNKALSCYIIDVKTF